MTIDSRSALNEPVLTESDMLARVRNLLAPAINPAQLWVLFLDGLRRQHPLMIPIEQCPSLPEPSALDTLVAGVVAGTVDQAMHGHGSVIFVRERLGGDRVTTEDHCWAGGLAGATARAGVAVAGTFLLTPRRVQPLTP